MEDKPWRNEEMNKFRRRNAEVMERTWTRQQRVPRPRQRWSAMAFHPKVPLDLTAETRGEVVDILEKVGAASFGNSSSLEEMGCREEETKWNEKNKRKRNSQGKNPRTSEENSWEGQAVGTVPTERPKLRRRMAAAAGKKESVSLSLFLDVNNLEVEEEFSTMATLARAEGVWLGRWAKEQPKARRKQIFEVQMWRQVRGLQELSCTRPVIWASTWPQWHTLLFEEQVAVDMRVVSHRT